MKIAYTYLNGVGGGSVTGKSCCSFACRFQTHSNLFRVVDIKVELVFIFDEDRVDCIPFHVVLLALLTRHQVGLDAAKRALVVFHKTESAKDGNRHFDIKGKGVVVGFLQG